MPHHYPLITCAWQALVRGECTHPGCNCKQFKFGIRDRRKCRTCKHKNKFHLPPKAKIGLRPTNVVKVKKHVFKDEVQETLDESGAGRRRRRGKLKKTNEQSETNAGTSGQEKAQSEAQMNETDAIAKQKKIEKHEEQPQEMLVEKQELPCAKLAAAKQSVVTEEEIAKWKDKDPKKAERLQKKRERQLKRIKRIEEEPADGEKKKRRGKKG